jgi:hypothetical protein
MSVDLSSTKRIGKEIATKPRHLLAYTQSRDQAVAIIQSAKKLRKSDDLFVRANVFINANLTKAEAKAQFDIRQLRRQTTNAKRNVTSKQEHASVSLAELQSASKKSLDADVNQSLLSTANNINAVVPSPSSIQPSLSVSDDPVQSNNTAAPAAEQSQQQGRHNQCY